MNRIAIVAVLALAGCAQDFWQPHPIATSAPQTHWEREGATQKDFYMERGQCRAQAFASTMDMIQAAIIFNGCMQGKGWYQTSN